MAFSVRFGGFAGFFITVGFFLMVIRSVAFQGDCVSLVCVFTDFAYVPPFEEQNWDFFCGHRANLYRATTGVFRSY